MIRSTSFLSAGLICLFTTMTSAAQFQVEKDNEGAAVKLDGKLLTRYLVRSGNKPILWPLIGPTGQPMTRAYPMADAGPHERKDHVHQRSLWFTHGDVNGVSFWHEQGQSQIVHREFVKIEDGRQAVIVTRNDWIGPNGKKYCEDVRTLTFDADGERRWIDFEITVKAANGQVTFGDTKEGSFGVRVAGSMKVDAKQGGRIVNSEGQQDGAAWGKPAAWVAYHGPVEGETVGVAILNHPSSFRYPTHWHVRTYGLFAANPFGLRDFTGSKDVDGSHTLEPGESFTLRYRVLLHRGDEQEGRVAEAFEEYAKQN